MTPDDFERRYGVPAKRLRAYLRTRWPHTSNDRWALTPEMVVDARARFEPTAAGRPAASAPRAARPARLTVGERPQDRFLELATSAGIPLVDARPVPWLTGRGHLADLVQRLAPAHIVAALGQLHRELGGDAARLRDC
jgi:hypothetical protein